MASIFKRIASGFNLERFESLDNLAQIKQEAAKLPFIGFGNGRFVYDLNGKVLKIARDYLGISQNKKEANMPPSPVIAKVYNYHPEYYWIMVEKAPKLDSSEEITESIGVPANIIQDYITLKQKISQANYPDVAVYYEMQLQEKEQIISNQYGLNALEKIRNIAAVIIKGKLNLQELFTGEEYNPWQWGKGADGVVITDLGY